ncbi:bifunctional DNA-formamidopyrimidine glycosylase/DNA-(apurinic or apyrimidinic site) lyase [bacterium]|nr:bifunctional DNA-formamidopyrimidine glycosylase/DNA-(apurinic or apyrimidinic site) lyase [bacterium]MBP9809945.1 bifunctional DNA-formamidopyrimidine glycosylase/DNA-(apurinic or apyrimidinic site) lyase [bacterium]
MPELPEVEIVRRGLELALVGDAIVAVEVLRDASIAYPDVESFIASLPGHKFGKVLRRGKYLLIELDRGAGLACHLRMSGRLLLREGIQSNTKSTKAIKKTKAATPQRGPQFLRVRIMLASGRELHFEDMRVFGRLWFKAKGKTFEDVIPSLAFLGVEPLESLTSAHLARAFKGKVQAVKTALLDQRILAGVGNIYADESLFLSGIHPTIAASKVTPEQLIRLVENVQLVLSRAIESGGSTLRDYTDSRGVNGNYQNLAWVYGREGEPCRHCSRAIERIKLNGRSSHFCRQCQPIKRKSSTSIRKQNK